MSLAASAEMARTLEEQRADFAHRRFLAMPLAGTVGWMVIGIAGALLSPRAQVLTLWIATGSIFYLGILFSRFTGENFFAKGQPKNVFDSLFMHAIVMALLVFAIAIPFFRTRLHIAAVDGRDSQRADVGAVLVDHPALGWPVSRHHADSAGDGDLVSFSRGALCCDTRSRLCSSTQSRLRSWRCAGVLCSAHDTCRAPRESPCRSKFVRLNANARSYPSRADRDRHTGGVRSAAGAFISSLTPPPVSAMPPLAGSFLASFVLLSGCGILVTHAYRQVPHQPRLACPANP